VKLSLRQLNDQCAALQHEFSQVRDNQARLVILEEMNAVLKEMEGALRWQDTQGEAAG